MSEILEIREYVSRDGAACHGQRRSAFLSVFSELLSPDAVRAGVDSYAVAEFAERIDTMETWVATAGESVVGFCSIRLLSPTRAELLYLYIDPEYRGAGVGSRMARHAERQVIISHPELRTIRLETVVPEYNQGFWECVGYRYVGPSSCDYPRGKIPALRLEKRVQAGSS